MNPTARQCEVCDDVRRQLGGRHDSRLDGEAGLPAATMRRIAQLEDCCRTALWIRDKIKAQKSFGSDFKGWKSIEAAVSDLTTAPKSAE